MSHRQQPVTTTTIEMMAFRNIPDDAKLCDAAAKESSISIPIPSARDARDLSRDRDLLRSGFRNPEEPFRFPVTRAGARDPTDDDDTGSSLWAIFGF